MTKKTEFEKFMTQVVRGKQIQVLQCKEWVDIYPHSEPLRSLQMKYENGCLRVKPTQAITLEKKIENLKQKLKVINTE